MRNKLTYLVLATLWLAPAIRYRIQVGAVRLCADGASCYSSDSIPARARRVALSTRNHFGRTDHHTTRCARECWIAIVRPWGQDWEHNLSDLRDWAIPVLTYIVLISTIRRGWRKWALLFVLVGALSATVGIYQHFSDSFRPFATEGATYKLGYIIVDDPQQARASAALGFFEHPNSLAVYLVIALTVALGWLEEPGHRLMKFIALAGMFAALYWTYAKAEILVLALIFFLFWLGRWIASSRVYLIISSAALGLAAMIFWVAMNEFPASFGTFWWRVDLWHTALQTLADRPITLLFGNGDGLFAANAIWPQPHNLYFDLLLKYGLVSLIILFTIGFVLAKYGLFTYRQGWLRKSPMLRAAWIALLTFFVTGVVESAFIGIETRMIFLLAVACLIGLTREIRSESVKPADPAAA